MANEKAMKVFSLSEVAAILDAPLNRIKAWTIGRPFKIVPTLRAARGTGSPNLFSVEDVYLFALVQRLQDDCLDSKFIKWVIADRRVRENFCTVNYFVGRAVGGKQPVFLFTDTLQLERLKVQPNEISCVLYLVNLRLLVNDVNRRIAKLGGWK
jgi:hypothetical protein